jgi:hypothetical protein
VAGASAISLLDRKSAALAEIADPRFSEVASSSRNNPNLRRGGRPTVPRSHKTLGKADLLAIGILFVQSYEDHTGSNHQPDDL